jgi:hypothetical protein
MQLLGLQCGTEGDCAVGTVEAAALGEARRGLLERISDPASSNEAIAAACRVLGVLGRRSVLAREEFLHDNVEALLAALRRGDASAEVRLCRRIDTHLLRAVPVSSLCDRGMCVSNSALIGRSWRAAALPSRLCSRATEETWALQGSPRRSSPSRKRCGPRSRMRLSSARARARSPRCWASRAAPCARPARQSAP